MMPVSSISLRDLEYIVTVSRLMHFGKAAKACHVSQPTLSAQIKKFENVLGVKIFERGTRSVRLTERGSVVVEQAREILAEAQKLVEVSRPEREPLTRSLKLGVIATIGPYLLPEIIKDVKKDFPKLELFIKEGTTDDLIGDLRRGEIDLLLAAKTFDIPSFEMHPVYFEPFLAAFPAEYHHPGIKREGVHLKDLNAKEMVLLEEEHCLRDQILDFCPSKKRNPEAHFQATSLETLKCLVAAGIGYSLIPALAANFNDRYHGMIKYLDFSDQKVGRDVVLLWRSSDHRKKEFRHFLHFLKKHKPKECDAV